MGQPASAFMNETLSTTYFVCPRVRKERPNYDLVHVRAHGANRAWKIHRAPRTVAVVAAAAAAVVVAVVVVAAAAAAVVEEEEPQFRVAFRMRLPPRLH